MKRILFYTITAISLLAACQQKSDMQPAQMLEEIREIYEQGRYRVVLDSIESLRSRFPKAVEERREALRIWQEASQRMAQEDIATTDSLLQVTTAQMNAEPRIYERNMLGVKRDSLQARYEALIGVVRMIRKRMEEIRK